MQAGPAIRPQPIVRTGVLPRCLQCRLAVGRALLIIRPPAFLLRRHPPVSGAGLPPTATLTIAGRRSLFFSL